MVQVMQLLQTELIPLPLKTVLLPTTVLVSCTLTSQPRQSQLRTLLLKTLTTVSTGYMAQQQLSKMSQ